FGIRVRYFFEIRFRFSVPAFVQSHVSQFQAHVDRLRSLLRQAAEDETGLVKIPFPEQSGAAEHLRPEVGRIDFQRRLRLLGGLNHIALFKGDVSQHYVSIQEVREFPEELLKYRSGSREVSRFKLGFRKNELQREI